MSALVVAGPPGDPPFPPLRRARAEADALARRYRTTALHDAPGEAVLAALPAAELVHFVCHGQADLADPLAGGLLLQDGWLTVQQLLTRPPQRSQLVILAACQSQVAGLATPDEVIGLPAALYQAGAVGVVAAQWQVDANAAFALLRRFHDYFLGGLPPAQALAAAQAWLRDATKAELASRYPDLFLSRPAKHQVAAGRDTYQPYREPVHWAAFGYTGR
jgi:CHAT domain-containing protein